MCCIRYTYCKFPPAFILGCSHTHGSELYWRGRKRVKTRKNREETRKEGKLDECLPRPASDEVALLSLLLPDSLLSELEPDDE